MKLKKMLLKYNVELKKYLFAIARITGYTLHINATTNIFSFIRTSNKIIL